MKTTILVPRLSSNDDTMQVLKWLINDKELVKKGDNFVRFETSKTVIDVQCETTGYILKHCEEGDNIPIGSPLASIYTELEELENHLNDEKKHATQIDDGIHETQNASNNKKFTKAALEYIERNNIDAKQFEHLELVTVSIIKNIVESRSDVKNQLNKTEKTESNLQDWIPFKKMSTEKITNSKQIEINLLSEGQKGGLNSSLTIQFESVQIRAHLKKILGLENQILPYILFTFSNTLIEYPKFTAYYTENQINYYNEINLGLAIDLGRGLKVPVIKNANCLSLEKFQDRIKDYVISYYDDALQIGDLVGSTITVTDLSVDNILYFQPLLNKHQSVVLGVGGDKDLKGYPMTLTVVFDHRVLTGREVSSFLNALKLQLQEPNDQLLLFNKK
uniref:Dihydrolipoamide acetyltransferase component of pyruvate dehydrogenase complex n=1 Tax=Candidatus Endohaliclona renieramycinifaciens TaxID=2565582 RepID=A0A4D6G4P8_9GAMM|nr:RenI [Candidatus Endohaliclona renieramycinifaciens]